MSQNTASQLIKYLTTKLCQQREYPKTICPSEVARKLSREELDVIGLREWREAMPHIRKVAWEMCKRGDVEVLQKGVVIDAATPDDVTGPIRVRAIQK
ncbi:hypothetical protein GQ43DRAFT_19793 [Delitschia confertaspora ATCC 74209]|uniref:S-adenosylmethionine tRNA ribosyltransferase n=1 Tax=Delitschia confertaspora ATCC 74209 TaxID=1513339 RepID=A0A9P4MT84_9PLEO|nr:hypothetical protein GQ43DRAFT_19793 [Delitschia confertaspora ATCC 74209]